MTVATQEKLSTIDLTPMIGTEIRADIDTLLSGVAAAEVRDLLERRGVLIFRGLGLDDRQQVAFSRTLGDLTGQGDEGIFKVTLDKNENPIADYVRGAFYWHIDGAMDDVPTRASLLGARVLAEAGGDTQFANTYAAYDALPEDERAHLDTLRVVHLFEASQLMVYPETSYAELQKWRQTFEPKVHPLVWRHRSGRRSLVLGASASHIEGMDYREGRELLIRLRDWATQPQFVYTHRWTPGDLVIWDNTGTMHRVTEYALDSGRMMHRTTLMGEEALV
jgi:alpha-ketoglutarate-dependent taurine dioxygenase